MAELPQNLQLTRLTVRGEWVFFKPPSPPAAEGKEPLQLPAIPGRKFYVTLEGRATGEMSDESVVQFVKILRDAEGYRPLFENIKLQRLVRDTVAADRQADRLFSIEGEFFLRKLE